MKSARQGRGQRRATLRRNGKRAPPVVAHRHPIRPSRTEPSSHSAEAQIHARLTNPAKQNIITTIRGSNRQVADIKSEPRPASNRNWWPASYWNAWPASSESAAPAAADLEDKCNGMARMSAASVRREIVGPRRIARDVRRATRLASWTALLSVHWLERASHRKRFSCSAPLTSDDFRGNDDEFKDPLWLKKGRSSWSIRSSFTSSGADVLPGSAASSVALSSRNGFDLTEALDRRRSSLRIRLAFKRAVCERAIFDIPRLAPPLHGLLDCGDVFPLPPPEIEDRAQCDPHVERQRRVADVPAVERVLFFRGQRCGAVDLRPARDAGGTRSRVRGSAGWSTGNNGRGPISDISPRTTFHNCGISSNRVLRMKAPVLDMRTSRGTTPPTRSKGG